MKRAVTVASRRRWVSFLCKMWVFLAATLAVSSPAQQPPNAIRLLVRMDDMGNAQASNEAIERCFREGIGRSTEVMMPAQWAPDAVRIIAATPGLDVGVHLCVTSEWERCKWRPLTAVKSFVDADGYLVPRHAQPKNTREPQGFVGGIHDLKEVETELRAQIEMLKRMLEQQGPEAAARFTHLSTHMYAATTAPDTRPIVEKLAREYGLRLTEPGPFIKLESTAFLESRFAGAAALYRDPATREQTLRRILEELPPGDYMWVTHPALNTPELRAFSHPGNEDVGPVRQADTDMLTSPRVREVIQRRGIQLISYADLPPAEPVGKH